MKKIVLFDFDGVIVDSFEMSYQATLKTDPGLTREQQKKFFDGNLYEEVERQTGKSITKEEDFEYYKEYIPKLLSLSPVEGIIPVLEELKEKYHLIVISSTISSPIAEYLSKYNLECYFDEIMGGDVHRSKQVKIKMILEKHKVVPSDCIFITDTLGDIREATKCGVVSVGVAWGFHEKERLQNGNPAAIVETPKDLFRAIQAIFYSTIPLAKDICK